ncbi:hypothetical protein BDV38DRAFT_256417 [Aspergillus pseudotamarii]|uniref:Uncharacterized protein n=1 Tax=Aspergillus pseudotamarii TaxID=132259 RepID=A0A5N6SJS3_ASPPS|nr:uncharacterized protein BDV38DRAFT_256417 [Aspergillus pseudotamarii]KAE8134010.1 hypothetical protein BDV38DRAFT_256417 [Aspergillus pseudotamarii]
MAPEKPALHPLKTPKNMTFPSELRERTYTCLDADRPDKEVKKEGEDTEITITPPPAYTEFLNTFSPIFSSPTHSRANFAKYMHDKPRPSPTSTPSSTTSTSFANSYPQKDTSGSSVPPYMASLSSKSPDHLRRLRLPPPYAHSPMTDSPRSAHTLRSPFTPSDHRMRPFDSPISEHGPTISIRHVVTTTITLKRAPQLEPPPRGKRRNIARRNT